MASHTLLPFPEELLAAKNQIREQTRSYGLDFFNVIYEMCDYEQMNQLAAYGGFPQRYPHWRFANMFGYCQVASAYGSGNFINVLHEHLRNHEKVLTSRVNSKDDIYDSIKTFFGKGH
jgi:stage V sporulation protein R